MVFLRLILGIFLLTIVSVATGAILHFRWSAKEASMIAACLSFPLALIGLYFIFIHSKLILYLLNLLVWTATVLTFLFCGLLLIWGLLTGGEFFGILDVIPLGLVYPCLLKLSRCFEEFREGYGEFFGQSKAQKRELKKLVGVDIDYQLIEFQAKLEKKWREKLHPLEQKIQAMAKHLPPEVLATVELETVDEEKTTETAVEKTAEDPVELLSIEKQKVVEKSETDVPVQEKFPEKEEKTDLSVALEQAAINAKKETQMPVAVLPAQSREPLTARKKFAVNGIKKKLGSTDSLESFIGGKMLSYFGITMLVLGIAFLLAFSLTRMGPAGRIGMGVLLGASLLGLGFFLEGKEKYMLYGRILMAGGWATLYFTVFGAYHIPVMKIIESPVLATLLLAAVSGLIITHTIKYASEPVTGVAMLLAYITLFVSKVSLYTHVAALVLAILICVFVWKFRWIVTQFAGLVLLYGGYGVWLYLQDAQYSTGDTRAYALITCFMVALWVLFKVPDFSKKIHDWEDKVLPVLGIMNVFFLALVRKIAHLTFERHGEPWSALGLCVIYLILGQSLRLRKRMSVYRLDSTIATVLVMFGLWFAFGQLSYCMIAWVTWGAVLFIYSVYHDDRYFRDLGNIVAALGTTIVLGGEMPRKIVHFLYNVFTGEIFFGGGAPLPSREVITSFTSGAIGLTGATLLFLGAFFTYRRLRADKERWLVGEIVRDRLINTLAVISVMWAFYKLWPGISCIYIWLIFGALLFQYGTWRRDIYLRLVSHIVLLWSICTGKLQGLSTLEIGASIGIGAALMYLDGFLAASRTKDQISPLEKLVDRIITSVATLAMMISAQLMLTNFTATMCWIGLGAGLFYYSAARREKFIRFASHAVIFLACYRALATAFLEHDMVTIFGHWTASSAVLNLLAGSALYYLHTFLLNYFNKGREEKHVLWFEEFGLVSFANIVLFLVFWFTLPPIAIAIAYSLCALVFLRCGMKFTRTYLQTHSNIALILSSVWMFTVNIGAEGMALHMPRSLLSSLLVIMLWLYASFLWRQLLSEKRPLLVEQERFFPSLLSYFNFTAILTLIYYHAYLDGAGWAFYSLFLLYLALPLNHSRYSFQALISMLMAGFQACAIATRVVGEPMQYFADYFGLILIPMAMFAAHVIGKVFRYEVSPKPLWGAKLMKKAHSNSRVIYALLYSLVSTLILTLVLPKSLYSILWGLEALLAAWYGLTFKEKIFRWLSLALFGMAICKILFYDVFRFSIEERIVTFIGVGVALLIVSFLYNRLRDQFMRFLNDSTSPTKDQGLEGKPLNPDLGLADSSDVD